MGAEARNNSRRAALLSALTVVLSAVLIGGLFLPWVHIDRLDTSQGVQRFVFGRRLLRAWKPDGWPWSSTFPGTGWLFARPTELELVKGERSVLLVLCVGCVALGVARALRGSTQKLQLRLLFLVGGLGSLFCVLEIAAVLLNSSKYTQMQVGGRGELVAGAGLWMSGLAALAILRVAWVLRGSCVEPAEHDANPTPPEQEAVGAS